MKNILINGNMNIAQRGSSFTQNGKYTLDRWKFLSPVDGVVTQSAGGPAGSINYILVKNGAADKQTAIVQVVEQQNAIAIIGGVASLSFQAKTGATQISNLRAALLGWTGTADGTSSSTIISTWGSNGTNPKWSANFIMLNVPLNLALNGAWQTFKIENIIVPANLNNLAVIVWTDDGSQASGAEWDLAQVQLERGGVATNFEFSPVGLELLLCQRYYTDVTGNGGQPVYGYNKKSFYADTKFPVRMRALPISVLVTDFKRIADGTSGDTPVAGQIDTQGFTVISTSTDFASFSLPVDGAYIKYTADAEI